MLAAVIHRAFGPKSNFVLHFFNAPTTDFVVILLKSP